MPKQVMKKSYKVSFTIGKDPYGVLTMLAIQAEITINEMAERLFSKLIGQELSSFGQLKDSGTEKVTE